MLSVYRAERRKLLAQLSTRVLALVCALGPLAFGAILSQQSGLPADTLLGVWVHASGYAVSLVVLGFGGYLGFPVLAGVLAGDLFSSEDRYGTWKTVLTRSRSRRDVFAGKVLAAGTLALALVALLALSSLLAGLLFTGDQPLVGLGGNVHLLRRRPVAGARELAAQRASPCWRSRAWRCSSRSRPATASWACSDRCSSAC